MPELWYRPCDGGQYFVRVADDTPRVCLTHARLAAALREAWVMGQGGTVRLTRNRERWIADAVASLDAEGAPP